MEISEHEGVESILSTLDKDEAPAQTEQPSAPETASEQVEQTEPTEHEEVEAVEQAAPAIEPPPTWKAELKTRWKDIPEDLQPILAQWETERHNGVNSKLNESAEARKSADAEKQAAVQERQRYAQQLETAIQQTISFDPVLSHASKLTAADWDNLYRENPAQAAHLKHQIETRVSQVQQWESQRQQLAKEQARTMHTQAESVLTEKIPEWRDEAKRGELTSSLTKMLQQDYGFKADELNSVLDPRHVLVARDAMLYRQMMKARQTVQTKRVEVAPKVVKPGSAQASRGDSQRVNALKQRAMRTGKDDDVLAALMASQQD